MAIHTTPGIHNLTALTRNTARDDYGYGATQWSGTPARLCEALYVCSSFLSSEDDCSSHRRPDQYHRRLVTESGRVGRQVRRMYQSHRSGERGGRRGFRVSCCHCVIRATRADNLRPPGQASGMLIVSAAQSARRGCRQIPTCSCSLMAVQCAANAHTTYVLKDRLTTSPLTRLQCYVCKQSITEEAIMTGDESYHAHCFTCRTCKRRIEELVFAKTSQGIYCMVRSILAG